MKDKLFVICDDKITNFLAYAETGRENYYYTTLQISKALIFGSLKLATEGMEEFKFRTKGRKVWENFNCKIYEIDLGDLICMS